MRDDRFSETQAFADWVYAVLGLTAAVSLSSLALAPRVHAWLWVGSSLLLVFDLLCLRTVITERELLVTLGALFPLYRRRIPLAEIARAEAVTYSPLADYGGWGIRWGRNGAAVNARGCRGVLLTLRCGKRLLIGSQRPDALAAALTAPR